MPTQRPGRDPVPRISPIMWRWFAWYARRFVRRHMHALRLCRDVPPSRPPRDVPMIIVSNHPSWWDPMIAIALADQLWPDRRHYFPIDAAMIEKYRFFARLGFFGVDADSARSRARFLRTAAAILDRPATCLWMPAQGELTDVRRRPVTLKPGVAHLARRMTRGILVPLAAEYPFWTERTPEALLRFGSPIAIDPAAATLDVRQWQQRLEQDLEQAMSRLAGLSIDRDAGAFDVLIGGMSGTSGVYDTWRRVRAWYRGQRFDPAHMPEPSSVHSHPHSYQETHAS